MPTASRHRDAKPHLFRMVGLKQKQAGKNASGGYHPLRDGHRSGARARGARKGFVDNVVMVVGSEIPIGEFRVCGGSRVSRREYHIELAHN